MERVLGEWRWMNVLYECDYKCMRKLIKIKQIKRVAAATKPVNLAY
jgi:hypothetical protein